MPGELDSDLEVTVAGLSEEGQAEVYEAIQDGDDAGEAVADAQAADYHRAEAEHYQHQQALAADAGDYEAARVFGAKAEYELEAVADHGGEDHTMEQHREVQHLDVAAWEQETAVENAVAAESYLESGDTDMAAHYGDVAAGHAETAYSEGDLGDHGGAYATAEPTPSASATATADSTYDSSE